MLGAIKDKIASIISDRLILAVARHAASAASGALGVYGADKGSIELVLTAAGLYLFAQVTSWMNKVHSQPVKVPLGMKVTDVTIAPRDSALPKAKEPTVIPR